MLSFSGVSFVLFCSVCFVTFTVCVCCCLFLFLYRDVSFSEYFCTITVFSLSNKESTCTSYVIPFRMVFFCLVTTGWIFDISLCENSINQSINQSIKCGSRVMEGVAFTLPTGKAVASVIIIIIIII